MTASVSGTTQADWKAPAGDGEILLWPEPPTLIAQTRENQRRLAAESSTRLQNVPLAELRSEARRWLGASGDAPVIASGHQVELHHPGVWAKDVLVNELALRLGGKACHFAVDSEAPRHLQVRWPGGTAEITDDSGRTSGPWADALKAPTPAHLSAVRQRFTAAASTWHFRPMMAEFFDAMRRSILDSDELPRVLVNSIHQVDWGLGLRHHALLASPIWQSPAYLLFAHHVMARAPEFGAAYNAVLGAYRREQKIRNPGRPWPDLRAEPGRVETPFWCDDLGARRRTRTGVTQRGSRWALEAGGGELALDPALDGWTAAEQLGQFLRRQRLRLAPRALILTAFLRLAVCDQFVHGIGGARYDHVTDRVIAGFFGLAPPAFSVTTATLLFPGALGENRVDLAALKRERRRLRHGSLNGEKMQTVRRIAALPRKSPERQDLFFQMHRGLRERLASEEYRRWEDRIEAARRSSDRQEALFDRELFYLIQPRERLQSLIDRYHDAIS